MVLAADSPVVGRAVPRRQDGQAARPEVIELPRPRGRRHVNQGIKLDKGGMGYQFLKERAENATNG